MSYKTFGDLTLDDKLVILNPHGPTLQLARIRYIEKAKLLGTLYIIYFIPHHQADLMDDDDPKKPQARIMVKSGDNIVVMAHVPPVPIAASVEYMRLWIKGLV